MSVRRSASGAGVNPCCHNFERMKASIGLELLRSASLSVGTCGRAKGATAHHSAGLVVGLVGSCFCWVKSWKGAVVGVGSAETVDTKNDRISDVMRIDNRGAGAGLGKFRTISATTPCSDRDGV